MSDGSTQISTSLTAETAALLVKCNPNLFPAGTITSSGDITTTNTTDTDIDTHQESQQKITSLVQSVLTKTATGTYLLSVLKYYGLPHIGMLYLITSILL